MHILYHEAEVVTSHVFFFYLLHFFIFRTLGAILPSLP